MLDCGIDSKLSSLSSDDDKEHVFPADELNNLTNSFEEDLIDERIFDFENYITIGNF